MNYDIYALKINMNTNIPSANEKTLDFKRSMLYIPPPPPGQKETREDALILNEYPYFTHEVEYDRASLAFLPYKERINFFFNMDRFNDTLTPLINNKLSIPDTLNDDYYKARDSNIKKNIITTLLLLFPTKYPMINSLSTSYEYVVNHIKDSHSIIFNPFAKHLYSYMNIGGKKYTIKSMVWLNDILNNPVYGTFIREYYRYYNKAKENQNNFFNSLKKVESDISSKLGEIIKKFDEIFDSYIAESKFLSENGIAYFNNFRELIEYIGSDEMVERLNKIITKYKDAKLKNYENIEPISRIIKKDILENTNMGLIKEKITLLTPLPKQWGQGNDKTTINQITKVIENLVDDIKRQNINNYALKLKQKLLFFTGTKPELEAIRSSEDVVRILIDNLIKINRDNLSSNYGLQQIINLDTYDS
jgi:hypothetical protein